jgi:hypothetical protein
MGLDHAAINTYTTAAVQGLIHEVETSKAAIGELLDRIKVIEEAGVK